MYICTIYCICLVSVGDKAEKPKKCGSIAELFSFLSFCRTPSPASVSTARTLAFDTAILTVREGRRGGGKEGGGRE